MNFLSAVELLTNIKIQIHKANSFSDLILQIPSKGFLGVQDDQLILL